MNQKAVVTYDFTGIKHIQHGPNSSATTWDEFAIFQILEELEKRGRWVEVRELCEEQIQKTPEWLTPYLCAGVANANLDRFDEAIRWLERMERMAACNPEYSAATRVLNQVRRELSRSSRGPN
jgi:hypothetical protein